MKRPLYFTSPLSPHTCIQRLQTLVERRNFYIAANFLGEIHVILDSLTTSMNSFRLLFTCSLRRSSFLPFIYLQLHGEMQSPEGETRLQLQLQSDTPHSAGEWAIWGFWLFLVILALAGGVIRIMTAPTLESIFIALSLAVAIIGGYWVNQKIYKVSVTYLLRMIYQTLRDEDTETQSQNTNEVDWLSSLSKPQ